MSAYEFELVADSHHPRNDTSGFGAEEMELAHTVAKRMSSGQQGYAEYSDLYQECLVWFVEHERTAQEYNEDGRRGRGKMFAALRNQCRQYIRAQRAARDGYSPDDQFYYSIGMIETLLPFIFGNMDYPVDNGTDSGANSQRARDIRQDWAKVFEAGSNEQGRKNPDTINRKGRSNGQSDLPAMVADVAVGYHTLNETDRDLLANIYASGDPRQNMQDEAAHLGITVDAMRERKRRAIGRLRKPLGGGAPFYDPAEDAT